MEDKSLLATEIKLEQLNSPFAVANFKKELAHKESVIIKISNKSTLDSPLANILVQHTRLKQLVLDLMQITDPKNREDENNLEEEDKFFENIIDNLLKNVILNHKTLESIKILIASSDFFNYEAINKLKAIIIGNYSLIAFSIYVNNSLFDFPEICQRNKIFAAIGNPGNETADFSRLEVITESFLTALLDKIKSAKIIKSLSLNDCNIRDNHFEIISQFLLKEHNLIAVSLENNLLTDQSLIHLIHIFKKGYYRLKQIYLMGNKFTSYLHYRFEYDRLICKIHPSPQDFTLNFYEKFTTAIADNTNIQIVRFDERSWLQKYINQYGIRNKAIYEFSISLAQKKLTPLKIESARITLPALKALLKKIRMAPTQVRTLCLKKCSFEASNPQELASFLKQNDYIEELDLSDTKLGDEGVKIICEAVKGKHNLLYLNLSNTGCGNIGATSISQLLGNESHIVELNISKNHIEQQGFIEIATGLANNNSLIKLIASDSNLKTVLSNFATALKNNRALVHLDFSNSDINETEAEKFLENLDSHISLTEIKRNNNSNKGVSRNTFIYDLLLTPNKKTPKYSIIKTRLIAKYIQQNTQHRSDLVTAVINGDLSKVINCLSTASINTLTSEGCSLLHLATSRDYLKIIEYLLNKGVNVRLRDKEGKTALDLAKSDEARKLLTSHSNNCSNSNNNNVSQIISPQKRKLEMSAPLVDTSPGSPPSKLAKSTFAAIQSNLSSPDKLVPISPQVLISDNNPSADQSSSLQNIAQNINISSASSEELFSIVSCGNLFMLKKKLVPEAPLWKYENGATLLHVACMACHYSCVEHLIDSGFKIDEIGDYPFSSPLHQTISCFFDNMANEATSKKYLDIICLLIKKGANPNILYEFPPAEEYGLTALHRAVISGHYRLMKIILYSKHINVALRDAEKRTALDWAVYKGNILMVDRLLIDRRFTATEIEVALAATKEILDKNLQPESIIQPIVQLLEKRKKQRLPLSHSGIQWTKEFSVVYGTRYDSERKPLRINSEKEHAHLALQNNFSRQRLFNPQIDPDTNEIKDYPGNPVTASITFIISNKSFLHGKNERCSLTIPLDFLQTYHVTDANDNDHGPMPYEQMTRLRYRANSAPDDIFHITQPAPLTGTEIQQRFENNDQMLKRRFHHGEQAVLDDLDRDTTVEQLVALFVQHPNFIKNCTIRGIILNLHSPRYTCINCEVGILGEQNSEKSAFLKILCAKLIGIGCKLPQYSPLRMLTQISSYIPYPSDAAPTRHDNHHAFEVDLRACNNNLILVKDMSEVGNTHTQYHSNKLATS